MFWNLLLLICNNNYYNVSDVLSTGRCYKNVEWCERERCSGWWKKASFWLQVLSYHLLDLQCYDCSIFVLLPDSCRCSSSREPDNAARSGFGGHRNLAPPSDWICAICGCLNFARRALCFQVTLFLVWVLFFVTMLIGSESYATKCNYVIANSLVHAILLL